MLESSLWRNIVDEIILGGKVGTLVGDDKLFDAVAAIHPA